MDAHVQVEGIVENIDGPLFVLKQDGQNPVSYTITSNARRAILTNRIGASDKVTLEVFTENDKNYIAKILTVEKTSAEVMDSSTPGATGNTPDENQIEAPELASETPQSQESDIADEDSQLVTPGPIAQTYPNRQGIVSVKHTEDGVLLGLCDYRTMSFREHRIAEETYQQFKARGIDGGFEIDELELNGTGAPVKMGTVRELPRLKKLPFALHLYLEHGGKQEASSLFDMGAAPGEKKLQVPPHIFPAGYYGAKKFKFNIRIEDGNGLQALTTFELDLKKEDLANLSAQVTENGFLLLRANGEVKSAIPLHDHLGLEKKEHYALDSQPDEQEASQSLSEIRPAETEKQDFKNIGPTIEQQIPLPGDSRQPAGTAEKPAIGIPLEPFNQPELKAEFKDDSKPENLVEPLPTLKTPAAPSQDSPMPPLSNVAMERLERSFARLEGMAKQIVNNQKSELRLKAFDSIWDKSMELAAEISRWRKANGENVTAREFADSMQYIMCSMAPTIYNTLGKNPEPLLPANIKKIFDGISRGIKGLQEQPDPGQGQDSQKGRPARER